MSTKTKTESRHGKLADTTTQTSITMNKALMTKAKAAAEAEGRSLSNWLEQLVKKSVPLLLIAFALCHLWRSPSKWSVSALGKTASTIVTAMR